MPPSEAPAAAEIALAMSECMNLLFLFAAPRVLTVVRKTDGLDGAASLVSLRRFLRQASGIRARAADATGGDVERLVRAAILVEEIAGVLGASAVTDPLPGEVVARARRALTILGFEEPGGGWDDFDGFTVPYPAPTPPT
jgi:hypothetical protein